MIERNPLAVARDWPEPPRDPLLFHRSLPGYAPTPLRDAPALAAELGVGRLWLKDESSRLGLPAFKIVGASWAVAYALRTRLELAWTPEDGIDALALAVAGARPTTLVAATDGNHGRAVARMARTLGLPARIYVPDDMVPARRAGIAEEGAEVVVVDGGYDDAVAASAREEEHGAVVVSDTSWPGYQDIPAAVIDGYSTVLWEVEEGLAAAGAPSPDVVLAPIGVGAFAAAVVRHFRRPGLERPPVLVGVEPTKAACVMASVRAGRIVTIPGPQDSIMAGLNCGTPSEVAWPDVSEGIDVFLAIEDDDARDGMRDLAASGIVAGECAGASIGALRAAGDALGIDPGASVLAFLTEGATDPDGYAAVVGRAPAQVDVNTPDPGSTSG